MKINFSEPTPSGSSRAKLAKYQRDLATEIARLTPQALTQSNHEEAESSNDKGGANYAANFTKGLAHDDNGLLAEAKDYHYFVEAINSPDSALFDSHVRSAIEAGKVFNCTLDGNSLEWRGWESPRSGHVYELEGLDCGAVGMAPAPRVSSSEMAAEMAEVYSLAILRDVTFSDIQKGGGKQLCDGAGNAKLSANEIVNLLSSMPFYSGANIISSTPLNKSESGLNHFERNRRLARTGSLVGGLNTNNIFRGSTSGAMVGPYISQFMLAGSNSLVGGTGGSPSYPAKKSNFDAEDGFIAYGNQIIDQRVLVHKPCLDYMTDWTSWLDVQNGANLKGADLFSEDRRFITTPRDLATYVHFDALYQAYLNACLILLSNGTPTSKGFPEKSVTGKRDAFATFGGPHILSLVTEVATRCLKAVRRQKFNYHRRARPEVMGGRLSLAASQQQDCIESLRCFAPAFENMLNEIPVELRDAITEHNKLQNQAATAAMRRVQCESGPSSPSCLTGALFNDNNLLLPMAFPEGSPMHPAYGAGHATVAGGCVTMLKAFFDMFDDCDSGKLRILKLGDKDYFIPNADGTKLVNVEDIPLTVQGELDKLAANISIGRNMAGVHYYSDYYDSLRMGERVAVGILLQQMPTYGERVYVRFNSFDGDMITISGEAGDCPSLLIMDKHGTPITSASWWLRHVSGQAFSEDQV